MVISEAPPTSPLFVRGSQSQESWFTETVALKGEACFTQSCARREINRDCES